jgi:hypothetical protein
MKYARLVLFLAAALLFPSVHAPAQAPTATADLPSEPAFSDADKETQRAAALKLLADLQTAIAASQANFVIPPGDYRFAGKGAKPFELLNVTGMTIEAAGATFYFDPHLGVRLTNCHNVTIHGLTVDGDPLPWSQGRITALDPETPTLDLTMEPGYSPLESTGHYRLVFFDGATGARLDVTDQNATEAQDLGNSHWKLTKFSSPFIFKDRSFPRAIAVGDRVALLGKGYGGGNIVLKNCGAVTLDTVTLYGASGFAYTETEGAGGNRYLNCKLVLRPNSNRLMASNADCFHSIVMAKGPDIENCEFSHAGDDLLAIHGFFGLITEKTDARNFTIASPDGVPFSVGDTLHFLRLPNGDDIDQAKVAAIDEITDRTQLQAMAGLPALMKEQIHFTVRPLGGSRLFHVQLDRDTIADRFDDVESPDFCGAGAIVKGNHLYDGNVRGILVKSHDVTIENNTVERTAFSGIVIEAEAFWFEGPFSRRIRIVGNHLHDNGWSTFLRNGMSSTMAAIHIGDYFGQKMFPRTLLPNLANEDITIQNNDISHEPAFGILVMNTKRAQIDNNKIDAPFASGQDATFFDMSKLLLKGWTPDPATLAIAKDPWYAIYVEASTDVEASGNQVTNAPPFLKGDIGYGPGTTTVAGTSPTPAPAPAN